MPIDQTQPTATGTNETNQNGTADTDADTQVNSDLDEIESMIDDGGDLSEAEKELQALMQEYGVSEEE